MIYDLTDQLLSTYGGLGVLDSQMVRIIIVRIE